MLEFRAQKDEPRLSLISLLLLALMVSAADVAAGDRNPSGGMGSVYTSASLPASAQLRSERIHFTQASSPSYPVLSAQVQTSLSGRQAVEYLIEARTGQSLELDISSSNVQSGFHITAPAAPRALHQGHGRHVRYSVTLPRDGTYRVLIYLLHKAAQNDERAEFSLDFRLRNPG